MKSICFFCTYFTGDQIPYYVKFYLDELSLHFSKIILLTTAKNFTQEESDYLLKKNINVKFYYNEGLDFGMWYKAFIDFDILAYDRIGLMNDSCILFKKLKPFFDWTNAADYDYIGMVITGKVAIHIQSYFIIINKNAITHVKDFFLQTGIKKSYRQIIYEYEIALSNYIISKGLKIGGYFNYSSRNDVNPSFILATDLIEKGSPLIKKKILSRDYRVGDYLTWFRNSFDIDYRNYINKITEVNKNESLIDFDKVIDQGGYAKSLGDIGRYQTGLKIFGILRKSETLKFLFHQLINLKRVLIK